MVTVTPIWMSRRQPTFENKYYSSLTNVVNTVNLFKVPWFLDFDALSGGSLTITSRPSSCSQCEELRVQFGSLTSVLFHAQFSCCFIVSFLWGHWDFIKPSTLPFTFSPSKLCIVISFLSGPNAKEPSPVHLCFSTSELTPCFLVYPSADSQCIWLLGATGAHSLWAGTAPNVWIQWVPQHPCGIIFLLVPCQVPF